MADSNYWIENYVTALSQDYPVRVPGEIMEIFQDLLTLRVKA